MNGRRAAKQAGRVEEGGCLRSGESTQLVRLLGDARLALGEGDVPPDLVVDVLDLNLAPAVPPTLLWLLHALLLNLLAFGSILLATLLLVLNPLRLALAVLNALPLLGLALRSLGVLLLGARLAGVLTAHFATLHLFHGGHYISVRGPLCSSNTGRLELFDLVEIVALYLVPQGGNEANRGKHDPCLR